MNKNKLGELLPMLNHMRDFVNFKLCFSGCSVSNFRGNIVY